MAMLAGKPCQPSGLRACRQSGCRGRVPGSAAARGCRALRARTGTAASGAGTLRFRVGTHHGLLMARPGEDAVGASAVGSRPGRDWPAAASSVLSLARAQGRTHRVGRGVVLPQAGSLGWERRRGAGVRGLARRVLLRSWGHGVSGCF